MRFLARNAAHRRALIAQPERIRAVAKELMRRFPLVVMSREVRADTELRGVSLKQGDMITLPSMLYNLDEAVYPDPLAVDWERPVMTTCTFGNGPHRCPGAPLGQRELVIALEAWLSRIPEFWVAEDQPLSVKGGVVATLDRLPLRWPV
jgi:cytochrome P450